MSLDAFRKAIEDKIAAEWDTSIAAMTPENVAFEAPAGGSWVRESIRPASTSNVTIGAGIEGMERTLGYVWFQIFIPANKGVRPAFTISDHIKSIFDNQVINIPAVGQILFRCGGPAYVGIDAASGSVQWRCLVPFQFDTV